MRLLSIPALVLCTLGTHALAQDAPPNGEWGTVNGLDSGDLAIRGWTMVGTTALAAGPQTGLLVTFWRGVDGTMARCIFSLVSPTGSNQFETCSIAVTVTGDEQ